MSGSRGPDAALVARECGNRIDELVVWLGLSPADKRGNLFTPLNPTRGDRNPGSFVIYGRGHAKQGGWVEYACPAAPGSKLPSLGGDALDLCAYIQTGNSRDRKTGYAIGLQFLGWEGAKALDRPDQAQARRALERDREIAEKNAADVLDGHRREAAQRWFNRDRKLIVGDAVWTYLYGRGIDLHKFRVDGRMPGAIKYREEDFHRESGRKLASMASLISSPEGKAWSVHRTFIEADGKGGWKKTKADPPRKIWPGGFYGGAIRLSKGWNDCSPEQAVRAGLTGETLAIGEGVETMLSVALVNPHWRCWAAGNVGAIGAVVVPASVSQVVLIGENDEAAEARRAFDLAVRRQAEQSRARADTEAGEFKLFITRPRAGDDDFNTSLQKLGERVE